MDAAARGAIGGHGMDVERASMAPPRRVARRRCWALGVSLGLGLMFGSSSLALAMPESPLPEGPAAEAAPPAAASPKPKKEPAAAKPAPTGKTAAEPKKAKLLIELPPSPPPPPGEPAAPSAAGARPAAGTPATPAGPTAVRKEVRLPLAPTPAEMANKADKVAPPRSTTMKEAVNNPATPQDRRFPTAVTNSAGPQGPAGAQTSGDRKGMLIENTGPQTGTIRNRW